MTNKRKWILILAVLLVSVGVYALIFVQQLERSPSIISSIMQGFYELYTRSALLYGMHILSLLALLAGQFGVQKGKNALRLLGLIGIVLLFIAKNVVFWNVTVYVSANTTQSGAIGPAAINEQAGIFAVLLAVVYLLIGYRKNNLLFSLLALIPIVIVLTVTCTTICYDANIAYCISSASFPVLLMVCAYPGVAEKPKRTPTEKGVSIVLKLVGIALIVLVDRGQLFDIAHIQFGDLILLLALLIMIKLKRGFLPCVGVDQCTDGTVFKRFACVRLRDHGFAVGELLLKLVAQKPGDRRRFRRRLFGRLGCFDRFR